MPFLYTPEFLEKGLSYSDYRNGLNEFLTGVPADEGAEKIRHYIYKYVALMEHYDQNYKVTESLINVLENAPATTWVIITEGWCPDAAFNAPLMAAAEKLLPHKLSLKFFHRDSNPELIDANLTDGGRAIPKVIVLNDQLNEIGNWGPMPAALKLLKNQWKSDGLQLKEIIPKVKEWYDADASAALQQELITLVKSYS